MPKRKKRSKKTEEMKKTLALLTSLGAWSIARVISFLRGGPLGRGGPLMTILSPESTAETTPVKERRKKA